MYVVEIEVSLVSTGRDSDRYLAPFWLLHVNISWHTFQVMRIETIWSRFFFFFLFQGVWVFGVLGQSFRDTPIPWSFA